MSDFLIHFGNEHRGGDLLARLQSLYGHPAPKGYSFDFGWGSLAVLQERFPPANVHRKGGAVLAWLGDPLFPSADRALKELGALAAGIRSADRHGGGPFDLEGPAGGLNGSFVLLFADGGGAGVVTDFIGSIPAYLCRRTDGTVCAIGSHPDTTARLGNNGLSVDIASAAEFLCSGHTVFPYTMHERTVQLAPGSIHSFQALGPHPAHRCCPYWTPPEERAEGPGIQPYADELYEILLDAVGDRCRGFRKVAVSLSGGLDSRLVLAAIPRSVHGVGITYGDFLNREMTTARRVARAYQREWVPLLRNRTYLEDHFPVIVAWIGCESYWMHAHTVGFAGELRRLGIDCLLGGHWMDLYLKGYAAADFVYRRRMLGLLPGRYTKERLDPTRTLDPFFRDHLAGAALDRMRQRRLEPAGGLEGGPRSSEVEFSAMYPLSHRAVHASYSVERRILPLRLPILDRRILDFAFRCPLPYKLGKRVFMLAANRIYGKGAAIASANDGVSPASGRLLRIAQRAIRRSGAGIGDLRRLWGARKPIQNSWYDYHACWKESPQFHRLRQAHAGRLDELNGILFRGRGSELLSQEAKFWDHGFRLLQLAAWLETVQTPAAAGADRRPGRRPAWNPGEENRW